MSGEALWPYALELYGRPGVEPLLLELQDAHGQCVPYLIWSLWLGAGGRAADEATLAAAASLARAWQDAAVAPLRDLRRGLKAPLGPERERRRLRERVKALELEAERMLLRMLEDASPAPGGAAVAPRESLGAAIRTWGGDAPAALLARLAELAA